jgi:hypothetical protein
MVYLRQTPSR